MDNDKPAALPAGETPAGLDLPNQYLMASQWQLVWWKFRKHKLALISTVITLMIYFVALFVEPLAPSLPDQSSSRYTYAPPQKIHFFHEGTFVGPFVYALKQEIEPIALRRIFKDDPDVRVQLGFFVRGTPYKLWGVIASDRRFFGPVDKEQVAFFLGADRVGRDTLTRLIYGTRISMSIGLVGVMLSFFLGIFLGGVSGYFGGGIDNIIQRIIEFLRSIPTIPLWMGLAAAVPPAWPSERIYFAITIIISLIGWTGLARVVRGRFLALREEDFIMAARLDAVSEYRIITKHMVPLMTSHIIAALTLAIPGMILAETSLSFLGLGLQPPVVSWGVLLQEAQNIRAVATAPWLLTPALAVMLTVLTLNFVGDGLRDAADPYGR